MTPEEKELLLKDLSSRLPYGVKVKFAGYSGREDCTLNVQHLSSTYSIEYLRMKPYLRPISSMTEEEKEQIRDFWIDADVKTHATQLIDFYNKYHFDYRGLIEKGLALEAPSGMY